MSLGIGASYAYGRESALQAGKELIKPVAKSAFRRLNSLYQSLSRIGKAISEDRSRVEDAPEALAVLDKLSAIVVEQIAQAGDAIEDWKDIVPEEVKLLQQQYTMIASQKETENE